MSHKITKEYFSETRDLCLTLGVRFSELDLSKFLDTEEDKSYLETLEQLYQDDPQLNNIPRSRFDTWWSHIQMYHIGAMKLSRTFGPTVAKHSLVFHLLKMKPTFI